MMEDKLICGSGDFSDDNPDPWEGEAAHPGYAIWKTNELGAYGIGSDRLRELSVYVTKIEAFDGKGKKIPV